MHHAGENVEKENFYSLLETFLLFFLHFAKCGYIIFSKILTNE
jgi:hypothetical protein